jgi:ABC-type multidrug transport system fused ATPase/permease subunit
VNFSLVKEHLKRDLGGYCVAAAVVVAWSLVAVSLPPALGAAISAINPHDPALLIRRIGLISVLAIGGALLRCLARYQFAWHASEFGRRVRLRIFSEFFQPVLTIAGTRLSVGDVISRATIDVETIEQFCAVGLLATSCSFALASSIDHSDNEVESVARGNGEHPRCRECLGVAVRSDNYLSSKSFGSEGTRSALQVYARTSSWSASHQGTCFGG